MQFHDRSKPKLPFLAKIDKLTLKFIWELKEPKIATSVLKKKKRLEDTHFPIPKPTTKLQSSKQCCTSIGQTDQWNRIENPEISLYIYVQLIFDYMPRYFNSVRKEQSFQYMMMKQPHIHKQKIEVGLLPYTTYKTTNSKCIINLNIRGKTIKLSEENRHKSL